MTGRRSSNSTCTGLTEALPNRDVIGQAKGVLIAQYAIDDDAAFTLLVRPSQHTNVKLAQISAALVTRVRDHSRGAHLAATASGVDCSTSHSTSDRCRGRSPVDRDHPRIDERHMA